MCPLVSLAATSQRRQPPAAAVVDAVALGAAPSAGPSSGVATAPEDVVILLAVYATTTVAVVARPAVLPRPANAGTPLPVDADGGITWPPAAARESVRPARETAAPDNGSDGRPSSRLRAARVAAAAVAAASAAVTVATVSAAVAARARRVGGGGNEGGVGVGAPSWRHRCSAFPSKRYPPPPVSGGRQLPSIASCGCLRWWTRRRRAAAMGAGGLRSA